MESRLIDYILLVLIVAVALNILFGVGKSLFSENMIGRHNERTNFLGQKPKCPVEQMDEDIKSYMDDVINRNVEDYNGKSRNCTSELSDENILEYQDNFFGFNDKLNLNSSNVVDVVDKLNEIHTSDNNEMTHYEGKKISDVFNGLTQSDLNKNNSLDLPKDNAQHHSSEYKSKSHGGESFSKYHWKYDSDTVNNGGKFYDDIEGSDSEYEDNMTL